MRERARPASCVRVGKSIRLSFPRARACRRKDERRDRAPRQVVPRVVVILAACGCHADKSADSYERERARRLWRNAYSRHVLADDTVGRLPASCQLVSSSSFETMLYGRNDMHTGVVKRMNANQKQPQRYPRKIRTRRRLASALASEGCAVPLLCVWQGRCNEVL